MNKGKHVALLMAALLVLSLLTYLTRTSDSARTAVVDNVRYVRKSDDAGNFYYEFYFVSDEVMEGKVVLLDDGTRNIVINERIPIEREGEEEAADDDGRLDYTLEPYGYVYEVSGTSRSDASVSWKYNEGITEFGEEPFERYSKDLFVTMMFGKPPRLSVPQAIMVAAIAFGGALIINYAEELWHFVKKKGEEEIPTWEEISVFRKIGGGVIGFAAVLLILFVVL